MTRPVLCTPLRVERAALRPAARSMRMLRTGMGPRRAAAAAATLAAEDPVLVAGLCGGLDPRVGSGEVVVAGQVRGAGPPVTVPSAPLLAGALRRRGLLVHLGPIVSSGRIARTGSDHSPRTRPPDAPLAVDMESHALAATGGAFAAVRAVVDSTEHPLVHAGTPARGVRALQLLRACLPAFEQWAAATGLREVLLAQDAVRAVARQVDVVLALGSAHSSHSLRLAEVAEREGAAAHLVDDVGEIDLRWLAGVRRVGVTAGASAPSHLVGEVVAALAGLGPIETEQVRVTGEDVTSALPKEVV